jgi:hypothetical protein
MVKISQKINFVDHIDEGRWPQGYTLLVTGVIYETQQEEEEDYETLIRRAQAEIMGVVEQMLVMEYELMEEFATARALAQKEVKYKSDEVDWGATPGTPKLISDSNTEMTRSNWTKAALYQQIKKSPFSEKNLQHLTKMVMNGSEKTP